MTNLFKFKFYLSVLLMLFGIVGLVYASYIKPAYIAHKLSTTNGIWALENISKISDTTSNLVLPAIFLLSGSIILASLKEPKSH
ncbi:hypothetical protein [Rhizosphaericola mali]|uniref:Uncharacterized protein n=1 Tax=Rhizosphaericola mali TaxID=2545455 RepID=A0A5P2FVB1_9BACT|nr:hypothetical protein [Rhizosphaericola mali]QES87424.1 hypothetical protein E0W69_001680 [Rhizosphaericola mali]